MYSETETIARVNGLSIRRLQLCIDKGWVSAFVDHKGLAFEDIDIARLQLICTLQDDMEVDDDLLPTLLSLLDQLYDLRRELRSTLRAISAQPDEVQQEILTLMQVGD